MTMLDQLVLVPSQLAEGLRAYLTAYVQMKVGPPPLFADRDPTSDALYVEPDVVRWNPEGRPASAEEELRATFDRREERCERQRWADVWPNVRRAVILGRPGEGKTVLTQRTCRDIAASSLRALNDRSQALSALALPIWLRVADVVRHGSVEAAVRASSLVQDAIDRFTPEDSDRPSAAPAAAHLVAVLSHPSTCLFLDAFDERDKTRDLRAALESVTQLPCRIVVTGRPYAYERALLGFAAGATVDEFELAPLSSGARKAFIVDRWFAADTARGAQVAELVERHARFRDLATNGLLLTLICLAANDRRRRFDASTRRIHLYVWTVRDMVRGAHKTLVPDDEVEVDERVLVLARAAWTIFAQQAGDSPFTFVAWKRALQAACATEGITFRESLTTDLQGVGLLVSPSTGDLMFLHRSFFEFLAATGLAQEDAAATIAQFAAHVGDTSWREVLLLTIGALGLPTGGAAKAGAVVDVLLAREPAPGVAGEIVARIGQAVAEAPEASVPAPTRARVLYRLQETMRDSGPRDGRRVAVAAKTRAEAGEALGWLGDLRFRADRWYLPDERLLGFVEIPAGRFWMGSDPARDSDAQKHEQPIHEVDLSGFFIARYPVTVAQFRAFVEDPENAGFDLGIPQCLEGVPNHPVVYVLWEEMLAYCRWLTEQLRRAGPEPLKRLLNGRRRRWCVTLPSEAERERAARGTEGRLYPWGNEPTDAWRANCAGTEIGGTSAVGCFPAGATEEGVEELIGNVAEWTRSIWADYPYNPADGRERVTDRDDRRVVRGGAFKASPRDRAASRDGYGPYRYGHFGFRLAVSPFTSDL